VGQAHAALRATGEGALLVATEVVFYVRPQDTDDGMEVIGHLFGHRQRRGRAVHVPVAHIAYEHLGHVLDGRDIINHPGADGAARHTVEGRGLQ